MCFGLSCVTVLVGYDTLGESSSISSEFIFVIHFVFVTISVSIINLTKVRSEEISISVFDNVLDAWGLICGLHDRLFQTFWRLMRQWCRVQYGRSANY